MTRPSAERVLPPSHVASGNHGAPASALPLLALLALCGAALGWLALSSARPYGDSGGYEAMLRHFLATGRVDYMKWSQPTFVGLLPVAVPWAQALGVSAASLQWLSVVFSLALLAGVWAFCRRDVGAWAAFWIAMGVLLLHEAVTASTAFMTDVPYVAYLVGFLLAHRELEARYRAGQSTKSPLTLWLAWGVMFLLSALTRSFSLALVPVFGVQWLSARRDPGRGPFALLCVLLGALLAAISVVIVRKVGVNAFSAREITAIPLILGGDVGRLNVRALLSGVLGLAVALLPALLMWSAAQEAQEPPVGRAARSWRGVSAADAIVGAVSLALGLMLWRKGVLNAVVPLPQIPAIARLLGISQVVLGAIATPILARVLVRGVRDALGTSQSTGARLGQEDAVDAYGEGARLELGHTSGVLWAIALAHFALMPILLHPLARHLMPAGIATLLLIAMQSKAQSHRHTPATSATGGASGAKVKRMLAGAMTAVPLTGIVLGVANERALNQKLYDVATQVNESGVPISRLAGGWSFFCARDLRPGLGAAAYLPPNDYVARYSTGETSAPYLVTTDANAPGKKLASHAIALPAGGSGTVFVLLRTAAGASPGLKPGSGAKLPQTARGAQP